MRFVDEAAEAALSEDGVNPRRTSVEAGLRPCTAADDEVIDTPESGMEAADCVKVSA